MTKYLKKNLRDFSEVYVVDRASVVKGREHHDESSIIMCNTTTTTSNFKSDDEVLQTLNFETYDIIRR